MDRRDFIKLCSLTGLGVASSQITGSVVNEVNAQDADPNAPLFVYVGGSGGPDHMMLSAPVGNITNSGGFVPNRDFAPGDIQTAGQNIIFAPPATIDANGQPITPVEQYTGYGQLLVDYASIATVIVGIDGQTNGHDTGRRVSSTGILAQNSPALAAVYAAAVAQAKPLSFITNGYYDESQGTDVAKTRLGNGVGSLNRLIFPNKINAVPDDDVPRYHTEETFARIMETRQARLDKMIANQRLPQLKNSMNLLYTARLGMTDLRRIVDYIPDDLGNGTVAQANMIAAAYAAGLCQSATISRGGFDTHGAGTDDTQRANMSSLVQGIRQLFVRAEELNFADRLIVVLGGDFGRTPTYNSGNGKDHYPTTQTVVFDGRGRIPGGRQLGAVDDTGRYRKVDPNTLQPSDGGVAIHHSHIHAWLRRELGIEESEVARLNPLRNEEYLDFTSATV